MKPSPRQVVSPVIAAAIFGWPARRQIQSGLSLTRWRWTTNPGEQVKRMALSSCGQLFFWTVGQDYIGVYMNGQMRPGLGHLLAKRVNAHMPRTPTVAWSVKVIEIALEATKAPIEGKLFRDVGVIPDAWAFLITQPLWSLIEAGEKMAGVMTHPERVTQEQNVEDSLSSIYGTLTRHGLSWLLWRNRRKIIQAKPQTAAVVAGATALVAALSAAKRHHSLAS